MLELGSRQNMTDVDTITLNGSDGQKLTLKKLTFS